MHIRELSGKSICILGFGKEGQAMLRALQVFAPQSKIAIADKNPNPYPLPPTPYPLQSGPDYLSNLDRFDVLIKSPGIPPSILRVINEPTIVTTPTQIFFDTIAETGATVIGVTGSKGKSTTSSLIAHILQVNSQQLTVNSLLVGNIGEPAIAHIADATPGTIFVMEMSSYQLMDLTVSPRIAVVTSFFPEHLDYHGSMEAYRDAKAHIARFQKPGDAVFYAADSEGARAIASGGKGQKIPFAPKDAPVKLEETKLLGQHNMSNIAGAFLVSQHLSIPKNAAIEAIKTFTPLPHRLQSLGVHHGLEWIDDSISTTPESAIAALDALGDRVTTIILGGTDRGLNFAPLAEKLKHSNVKTAILFPETGSRIRTEIEKSGAAIQCFNAESMEGAVAIAKAETSKRINESTNNRPLVLLSPASPSYGMFKNFEERGEKFKESISSYKN